MMLSYGVDGLIIEPTKSNLYNPNIAYYLSFKEQDIPIIMINAFYEEIELPYLCLDDVQSSYLATKELITKGHTQIGLIAKMDDLQGKYRMKGYIKALGESKLRFYPEQIFSFNTETKQTLSTDLKDFLNKIEIRSLLLFVITTRLGWKWFMPADSWTSLFRRNYRLSDKTIPISPKTRTSN